jgi:DnaA family protein
LVLSQEVGQFLINRNSRDMNDLTHILDQLDQAAMAAQRRLTIPFIKSVLD